MLDKEDAADRSGIFMIDASKGYVKDGNKNRLREQDIHKIVTTFLTMDESDPKYARFVPNEEIKVTNEYNLNIPRYVDTSEEEDEIDLQATFAELAKLEQEEKEVDAKLAVFFKELGIVGG